jgi:hypothetical protein
MVTLHPSLDRLVRKLWARLIDSGQVAGYSTSLNLLLVEGVYAVLQRKLGPDEALKLMEDLLSSRDADRVIEEVLGSLVYLMHWQVGIKRRGRPRRKQRSGTSFSSK